MGKNKNYTNAEFIRNNMGMPVTWRNDEIVKIIYQRNYEIPECHPRISRNVDSGSVPSYFLPVFLDFLQLGRGESFGKKILIRCIIPILLLLGSC